MCNSLPSSVILNDEVSYETTYFKHNMFNLVLLFLQVIMCCSRKYHTNNNNNFILTFIHVHAYTIDYRNTQPAYSRANRGGLMEQKCQLIQKGHFTQYNLITVMLFIHCNSFFYNSSAKVDIA